MVSGDAGGQTIARRKHLPMFKKAVDLAIYLEKILRNFSRYHKVIGDPANYDNSSK
jgi:hypothetical protein